MSINSIASNVVNNNQPALRTNAESREVGPDRDGDADDASANAGANTAIQTTSVNALGQIVGGNINTKA